MVYRWRCMTLRMKKWFGRDIDPLKYFQYVSLNSNGNWAIEKLKNWEFTKNLDFSKTD